MAEHIPIRLQFQAQAYTRKKYETFHVDKSAGAIYSRPDSQSWEIWENVSRMYARVRIYREYPSRSYRSTIWYERLDDNKEFNLFDLLSPERDDTGTLTFKWNVGDRELCWRLVEGGFALFKEGHERPLAKFTKRGATLEIVKSVEHIQELCIIFVTVYFMGLLVPEYCTEQGHCHCDITDDRPTHEHTQNARL